MLKYTSDIRQGQETLGGVAQGLSGPVNNTRSKIFSFLSLVRKRKSDGFPAPPPLGWDFNSLNFYFSFLASGRQEIRVVKH